MNKTRGISRRRFIGGGATALGAVGLSPVLGHAAPPRRRPWVDGYQEVDPYDALAKLSSNENPYGPSESVLEAMNSAWKYANRYGYPDGGIQDAIAEHHGVPRDHILLGAGSGESLEVVGLTFLEPGKVVVGVEPSYGFVYSHATGIDAEAITLPLLPDHRQDMQALIDTTLENRAKVGFVYLCNPNNPTGRTVTATEVRQLLDGIPEDVPVLIDEAYHHFVEDPDYATSVPYILEGRPVIVARTFSKIYGMAAMRLGYAIARPDIIRSMRAYSTGSVNALVKWGGAAALRDAKASDWVRRTTLALRKRTTAELEEMGYEVIPSETNFFMVKTGRDVSEVRAAFREKGVAVGRPFPPMLDYLRVSIGTENEMKRFMTAWKEIFA